MTTERDDSPDLATGDLIFIGPPGVGKGTQAKALVQDSGWVHLSTGELFRDQVRRHTELGRLAKSYLDRGEYVPDDVTVSIVRERLRDIPRSTRIAFDGFPRTVAQAEALDALLREFGRRVGTVILLEAPFGPGAGGGPRRRHAGGRREAARGLRGADPAGDLALRAARSGAQGERRRSGLPDHGAAP